MADVYHSAELCGTHGEPQPKPDPTALHPLKGHAKILFRPSTKTFPIAPPLFVIAERAGGSGLAPVLAILEDAVRHKLSRDVTFLFGARTQADLYGLKQIEHIRQNWSGTFQFVPVLSQEPEGSDWEGARGLVTEHIPQNPEAIEQVYMCGPPPMLDAASAHLQNAGLADSQIFADRFTDRSINTNTSNNKPTNEPELAAG